MQRSSTIKSPDSDVRFAARLLALGAILVTLALPSTSASVPPPKQFMAVINASQETPPNSSNAFGVGHFTFNDLDKMLCFSISYSGLSSAEILAHVHGPGLPGVAGPIAYNLAVGSPKTGCVGPLTTTQKTDLNNNKLYVNVHTVNFTGGEIRGQILRIK